MTEYDLLITGARIPAGADLRPVNIGIRGGLIVALDRPDAVRGARQIFDADGLVAMPGVIDAHVHFGLGSPMDWTTETRAAAVGGVTTVLQYIHAPDSYLEVVPAVAQAASEQSVIDFGFHLVAMNEIHLTELPEYARTFGTKSFKQFMNFRTDEGSYLNVAGSDLGFLLNLVHAAGKIPGACVVVHAENAELIRESAQRVERSTNADLADWERTRPTVAETVATAEAILVAADGRCPVYVTHVTSAATLRIIRALAPIAPAVLETCPAYLTHTVDGQLGQVAKTTPPLRYPEDSEALWEGIRSGLVAVVASDHNSRRKSTKTDSVWTSSSGFPGVGTLLPVLISEGYHKRGIPLSTITSALSTNPARAFGLANKGAIAPGFHADIVLVDLDEVRTVKEALSESNADFSIYDGWRLKGWPVATFVRGSLVANRGAVKVGPGAGLWVQQGS